MNKKYRYVINLKITGGEKLNSGITFLKASEFKPNKSGKYTIASMKIMKIKDFDNPEITHDKKFKENEVVFIPFDEMLEISKLSTVLKEIRILYRVHTKGYNKGIAVSRKIEKTEKIKE